MNIQWVSLLILAFALSAAPARTVAQKFLRDPTKPANTPVAVNNDVDATEGDSAVTVGGQNAIPNGKLSAIVVAEASKYAIINNEIVYEGQMWRNAVLSEVRPNSIILTLNEQQKEITLNDTSFITESHYEF